MKNFFYGLFGLLCLFQPAVSFSQNYSGLILPTHSKLVWVAQAKGVQIYVSKPKKGGKNVFEWTLLSPEATLLNQSGKKIGSHYSGPTWQSVDGSKIIAFLPPEQKVEQKGAIAWLLLKIKTHEGKGILSQVHYVIRTDTLGGLPPRTPPRKENQTIKVPYKAVYLFLAPAS
ncbi:DUF3455 domain-containing protein [Candidatus Methylacidiphilum infernorum]|uniref:DUF3455 domain-containing protein n=1 Tax=Candidatus Methylacidiphilum infernorum TaxID=511746 RepID=A0ABX7PTD9_9BACT|nr:DUF3455 domain-containing protein [Candidatus Methylacidiphilum infernorum]QSR86242.1 DUF3455 domain-containing protein [Candidatus Methylacidiphilum infernorum]